MVSGPIKPMNRSGPTPNRGGWALSPRSLSESGPRTFDLHAAKLIESAFAVKTSMCRGHARRRNASPRNRTAAESEIGLKRRGNEDCSLPGIYVGGRRPSHTSVRIERDQRGPAALQRVVASRRSNLSEIERRSPWHSGLQTISPPRDSRRNNCLRESRAISKTI